MEAAKKAIPEPSLEILIAGLGYEQGSSFLTSFPYVLMEWLVIWPHLISFTFIFPLSQFSLLFYIFVYFSNIV